MNLEFEIKGMTCGHCVKSVTTELKKIAGVEDVAVELKTGKVTVTTANELEDADVSSAIEEAGYELVG